jgi:hypothetical protein
MESGAFPDLDGTFARFSGNDIVVSDILGFDIQVFSPNSEIRESGGIPLTPNDSSLAYSGGVPVDNGTFIDLGWTGGDISDLTFAQFSTNPNPESQLVYIDSNGNLVRVLDTFSKHYESNGIDEDDIPPLGPRVDEATNGLDDDGANGVDDNGERETLPPYPFRIAGIKVSFRIVERTTKQVRQTSVVHSFLPK